MDFYVTACPSALLSLCLSPKLSIRQNQPARHEEGLPHLGSWVPLGVLVVPAFTEKSTGAFFKQVS